MHIALQGLLIGAGVGVVLFLFEYFAAHKSAAERGKHQARKPELNQDERARITTMLRFGFILPIAFAIGFWWVWG